MSHRPVALAAVPLALALMLSACGNGSTTSTTSGGGSSTAASGDGTSAPSATGGPPRPPSSSGDTTHGTAFVEVVRSGGFAGVRDVVRVAADGTAKLLSRDGRTRSCRPAPDAVRRLRQMDLAALSALPSSPPVADGYVFSVRTPSGAAVAGEGDKNGRRADLLDAAAAVVAACLAGQPAGGGGKL